MRNFWLDDNMQNCLLICICIALICVGCSKHTEIKIPKDLSIFPQDAKVYLPSQEYSIGDTQAQKLAQNYLQSWYAPWSNMRINPNVNEVFWAKNSLLVNPGFGENLQKNSLESTQAIYEQMDISHYPNANIKAVIVLESNVRAVPTNKPRFDTADDYPFDQWQNSIIFAGTPVLITHISKNKQYAHIQTQFVYGWVEMRNLAFIDEASIAKIMNTKQYIMPNADNIALYDMDNNFALYARIGQIFATQAHNGFYLVYNYHRLPNGKAQLSLIKALDSDFSTFPKDFTPKAMADIINTMMGNKYGWGGYLGNRDCSAFIRDSFANFGLYLPRNSKAQAHYANNMIDLSKFTREEKEQYILENGIPFGSVLWLKGHIMLYLGRYDNYAMVAHSAWSVKTETSSNKIKNMLGGVVITTLYAGIENSSKSSHTLLIDRILGISNLYSYMEAQ